MSYLPHQIEKSNEIINVFRQHGMAMLWGAPRSGKTRTAIRVAETTGVKSILFLTKKAAIAGVKKELLVVGAVKSYLVTNYEQASKLDKDDYDFVILDESHNLNGVGKPKKKHRDTRALTYGKPVLFMSGTPAVENLPAIYYQLAMSNCSPFDQYKTFYAFYRDYGIRNSLYINGRAIEQYNKANTSLAPALAPYVVRMTQADAGITLERKDVVHKVPLDHTTHIFIKALMVDNVLDWAGEQYGFDSDMGVRAAVHQAETGALLIGDELEMLNNTEVVDYIRDTFKGSLAIMAHYRATRLKIEKHLPDATIFSSVSDCEGTDLSGYDHFIIVNSDYSGSKFIQRLERNTRLDLDKQPVVNHIITDGGISEKVYDALKNKEDFNLQRFRNERKRYSKADKRLA